MEQSQSFFVDVPTGSVASEYYHGAKKKKEENQLVHDVIGVSSEFALRHVAVNLNIRTS